MKTAKAAEKYLGLLEAVEYLRPIIGDELLEDALARGAEAADRKGVDGEPQRESESFLFPRQAPLGSTVIDPSPSPIFDVAATLLGSAAESLDTLVRLLHDQAEGMREDARKLRGMA